MGDPRGKRRLRAALFAFVVALALQPVAGAGNASGPSIRVPRGYHYAVRRTLAPGLDYFRLTRRNPSQVVNVARFSVAARYELRPVLSHERLLEPGRRPEPPSSMSH